MIETFFGQDALSAPGAFLAALFIGAFFGLALEQAGFGSSRKLAGIFYFRDMTVLKVMFTGLIVAMLGLAYATGLGWIRADQLFFLPSIYGAQIAGGLIFGVGFVLGGWCPGTAAVGLASGKLDALIFLGGAVGGSILFNEIFDIVKPLYVLGDRGVQLAWENLGVSQGAFALAFTLVAVGCFWGAEFIERKRTGGGKYLNTPFLKAFSLALIFLAVGLFALSGAGAPAGPGGPAALPGTEGEILAQVESAEDHLEPKDLADRLLEGGADLLVVDVRSVEEYEAFHIRGAIRASLPDLPAQLEPHKNRGTILLYSNGMTHPAQARDALARLGFQNVRILTDGIVGFKERCLKPVSLRREPVPAEEARKINAWRAYFSGGAAAATGAEGITTGAVAAAPAPAAAPPGLPGLVETEWLARNLALKGLRIIDCRSQPSYNGGHVPGSVCMTPEHFRGVVRGVSASLLPVDILARHLSLLGLRPEDTVVILPEEKLQDATLIGMALERAGHLNYAILTGGFAKWAKELRPVDTLLPEIVESSYPVNLDADHFSVDAAFVLERVKKGGATILDVRPADYYLGKKSDEARAGHIPGAINRPFSEDVMKSGDFTVFKPVGDLEKAYAAILPSKDSVVIVHCRTGHQASQTFFVLKHVLGYRNVLWYDAGWSEWAARFELPVETGPAKKYGMKKAERELIPVAKEETR
jgi:thiosulfate/3-mercaptopyruvate sulfurtransferase